MNIYMPFTRENVLKLLANPPLKWQTRRLMREQPTRLDYERTKFLRCKPFAQPGDVLGVLEGCQIQTICWNMMCATVRGIYLADRTGFATLLSRHTSDLLGRRKRRLDPTPARFMYRSLCRIRRPILSVRPEWLQDITEVDAIAEGVARREHFIRLWDSIYKKPGTRWTENPAVWVYEFWKGAKQ